MSNENYNYDDFDVRPSARAMLEYVMPVVNPQSVVDIGCGAGAWLAVVQEYGINDIFGIDGSWVNRKQLKIPEHCFRVFDLRSPLDLGRTFDLALCLEVAEHVPHKSAGGVVSLLVASAPVILFSAAIPCQGGIGHVNEQWPGYWSDLFAKHDYLPVDYLRQRIWNDENVVWWYRQNTLLYVKANHLDKYPAFKSHAVSGAPLSLVHPQFVESKIILPLTFALMRALGRKVPLAYKIARQN